LLQQMKKPSNTRRSFLGKLVVSTISALGIANSSLVKAITTSTNTTTMNPILEIKPMGFTWDCYDPFLFCAHHEDAFPAGNEAMGPVTPLSGRHLGDDFIIKDGFRMYHGKVVPGFPGHPHRGFETVTIVRKGVVDHSDSLGASGRYGDGDVQWMTAGKGVQHAEMFPLINTNKSNDLELFQVWLNLPKKHKMVEPHFKMLWGSSVPKITLKDAAGKNVFIEVLAGKLNNHIALAPPPDSWAADASNEVLILNIKLEPGATYTLPKASTGINRTIYFYEGNELKIEDGIVGKYQQAKVIADVDLQMTNGSESASILVLQGKPIGEPVMQYGPFVMNTKEEINKAFDDYHTTQFGGWPWPKYDNVHDRNLARFAKHADGTFEKGT
jgi:quercetin 2,3-dioxygenase